MKLTIKSLQKELDKANANAHVYENILRQIHQIIFKHSTTYVNPYNELPAEIMRMDIVARMNEGAYHPLRDVIDNQREIIRWLIKPSTADNSLELQQIKKNYPSNLT